MYRVITRICAVALGIVLGLAAFEIVLRCAAPRPERSDAQRFHESISAPDRERLYVLRSDTHSDWQHYSSADPHAVPFSINRDGRRARDFDSGGNQAPFVIACFGDSTTMGFGVGDTEHYPYLLGQALARGYPDRRVRSFNFGTHGYTSAQGRQQMEATLRELRPQLMTIAFGYNDSALSRLDEASARAAIPPAPWLRWHEPLFAESASYRFFWNHAHPLRAHERPRARVGRVGLKQNLRRMIELAQSIGAAVVLIDSCLPHNFVRPISRDLAAEFGCAHLCLRELFEHVATEKGPAPYPEQLSGSHLHSRLRVRWRGMRDPVFVLIDAADEERTPQLLRLHDDGTRGDESPNDGIFTIEVPVLPTAWKLDWTCMERDTLYAHPAAVHFEFYREFNLAPYQGFDTPILSPDLWLRGIGDYLRVDSGDIGHPNAAGHRAIATALIHLLERQTFR